MQSRMADGLRAQCTEKEAELDILLAKLETLQIAKEQRRKELGGLKDKWDQGALYNTEVDKYKVDVKGDMGAAGAFNKMNEARSPKVQKKAVVEEKKKGPLGVNEQEFAVPEWAKNEQRKVIRKETVASEYTKEVDLSSTKQQLATTAVSKDLDAGKEKYEATKGDVKGVLSRFQELSKEEDPAEKIRKDREERKKREKEEQERLAKMDAEQKRVETELKARAEADAEAKQKRLAYKLPGVPLEEPADPAEKIAYFNKKKDALDQEIIKTKKAIENFV
eukprot:CAMPEP_0184702930 /NCGR_PEP_ID=MMETSP0313-20130426/25958_1 /TAXON_ID=2792 /ORGANISM="Porphyridium aerugineum, Strain SAG 1380-2" /LENGTH=277 /DNA_ID=CAMNT_0027163549 /DNA_START=138 /DNA_END=971 /DNA_ORIENTATION=+